ncbi:glycosyltransferase [Leptolyngbya boryana CZ1]|uniref:Glycosyltransferase n=1 Tax=Leptolyngbya boryana CZ1 TaxID=3060204 RepID=A0AA97AN81_LEPBY|nr:glycosyltransferase [Leptolyngbya boryana]WNZ43794.1 glycosyltransferase [Leptolyngbya boryana CZ1]
MTPPRVTLIVSPRERFSYTRQSLESILEQTTVPYSLIYVDGGSPKPVQQYLEAKSQEKNFKLIRTDSFLAPNQARNLAIPHVETEYILFVDNDVVVSPNWLEKLLACADETEAALVCPLTCIGQPLGQTIHLAGGEAHIYTETQKDGAIKRKVHEKHYFVNRPVADVQEKLIRQQCEFAEFHCMLVRTSIFEKIGLLDEGLLSTREHIDFCMSVTNAGGTVFCEPESVVTYVPGLNRLDMTELAFFMLRWSDAWEIASLEHFSKKWNLTTNDKYFKKRYDRMGHRRYQGFLRPLVRQVSFGKNNPQLEKVLIPVERSLNRLISDRYANSTQ